MITGFNTDIVYQGVTYHVQTEDKGTATPLILSLVYDRGTILASKRSPYDDLLSENFDEKILAERLQRQHKLICAAISSGRIEDLKRMSVKPSAVKTPQTEAQKIEPPKNIAREITELPKSLNIFENPEPEIRKPQENDFPMPREHYVPRLDIPAPQILKEKPRSLEELPIEQNTVNLEQILAEERIEAQRRAEFPIPRPKPKIWETGEEKSPPADVMIVEAVEIIEEVEILSADAVEIVEEKTPSQKFLEDLSRVHGASVGSQVSGNELMIGITNDEDLYSGDEKSLEIYVFRGAVENVLGGSHIMVKILGSAFAPLLYHAKTDSNGRAVVHLKLPVFDHGRAVVLIKAMSGGEEVEFRKRVKTR